jgi:hypothetical protein
MDRTLRLLLAGLSPDEIRSDLDAYLATQKQSGGVGKRGEQACKKAIGILASWFSPSKELSPFRDAALSLARTLPEKMWLPLHWAVISAAYPFWFQVARQVGRLLNLQDQITRAQVFNRLKEQYGDRETVDRDARYVIRSFVAWGVLKDTEGKGCYEQGARQTITEKGLALLLLEAALRDTPEGKGTLLALFKHPALFPFTLPPLTAEFIAQHADRIEVFRQGSEEDLLALKGQ